MLPRSVVQCCACSRSRSRLFRAAPPLATATAPRRTLTQTSTPTASLQGLLFASRIASQLQSAPLRHLQQHGFVIIDSALLDETPSVAAAAASASHTPGPSAANSSPTATLPSLLADELRARILALHRDGLTTLNHTHLVTGATANTPAQRAYVPKHSIYEADFTSSLDQTPPWREFVHARASLDALNAHFATPPHPLTFDRQTVKAQVSKGQGGCFPMHFDTDRKIDSRRITAILYLNPDWSTETDGGALRLYPFPSAPIDIAPLHNRLVLFDSSRMLHRVLPCHRDERVCITTWFWQKDDEWRKQLISDAESTFAEQRRAALQRLYPNATPTQLATLAHLLTPSLLPHLAKLFHEREWFASLEESHLESYERQMMLVQHLDQADMIRRALGGPLRLLTQRADRPTQREGDEWRSWFPAAEGERLIDWLGPA